MAKHVSAENHIGCFFWFLFIFSISNRWVLLHFCGHVTSFIHFEGRISEICAYYAATHYTLYILRVALAAADIVLQS